MEFPTKGDWASTCMKDLKELEIQNSLEEIRLMTKTQFTKILKEKVRLNAFKYLKSKQGSKGKDNNELELCMSEYLLPTNTLTISQKQQMFSVKNRMVNISANFSKNSSEKKCLCSKTENMKHIYECTIVNN